MSSRALRRLQKQQEEQKAVQIAEEQKSDDDVPTVKTKQSAFALLNEAEYGDDENDRQSGDVEEDTARLTAQETSHEAEPALPKFSRKKKKRKSKATGNDTPKKAEEDDIDAYLVSVAQSQQANRGITANTPTQKEHLEQLLAVDAENLHAINEMRRLFGREAIDDRPQPAAQQQLRRRGQRVLQEGRGFPAVSLKRNIFVQGKEEWPRATTGGLGMEIMHRDPNTGITEYRFVHSTAYQDTQRQYEIAVASMDPNRLVVLLQHNPYHIATLLQVSEIMKHDRMHTEAGDVLERALFAFGRTVHSTFPHAVAAGKARLSFDRPENREFFLSCWRYIQDLSMRSTWRTVYEWAKLLFSLEPKLDPYCLGLVMDQYALRANQAEHYLKLVNTGLLKFQSEMLWCVSYSVALCHLRLSHHDEARSTLHNAIEKDRFTAHQLCKALDIEPLPASLWGHHEAPDPKTNLFSTMYTTRAKDLWNTPDAKSLLGSVAKDIPKCSTPQMSDKLIAQVTVEAARHVYLTENDAFMRLLSQCELESNAEPGDRTRQDPFPPKTEERSYDPRPAGGSSNSGVFAPGVAGLGRVPNEEMRRLMDELMRMQMGHGRAQEEEAEEREDEGDFDDEFEGH